MNNIFMASYVLRCFQSDLLESDPKFFGFYYRVLILKEINNFWPPMVNLVQRIWYFYTVALKLDQTKPN